MIDTKSFLSEQLVNWQDANQRYEALRSIKTKTIHLDKIECVIAFNPLRAKSTKAKIDKKSIQERPCFLCKKNRPNVQIGVDLFETLEFLVNPFPACKQHFTIVHKKHTPQRIKDVFHHFVELSDLFSQLVFFYNGAECGASAPDHMHFQGVEKGFLPLQREWKNFIKKQVLLNNNQMIYQLNFGYPLLAIESREKEPMTSLFEKVYRIMSENDKEPKWNLLTWTENDKMICMIIPRKNHRPRCFFETGEEQLMISPATIDLSGVFTTVREEDFLKVNTDDIAQIFSEVCLSENELNKIWEKIIKDLF